MAATPTKVLSPTEFVGQNSVCGFRTAAALPLLRHNRFTNQTPGIDLEQVPSGLSASDRIVLIRRSGRAVDSRTTITVQMEIRAW